MAKRRRSGGAASRSRGSGSAVPVADRPTTKVQRQTQARRQRVELQRTIERRQRLSRLAFRAAIVVAVIAAGFGVLLIARPKSPTSGPTLASGSPAVSPGGLPGMLTGSAPWPNNTADLQARLSAIGLPALASEGTVLHIHQHLDIFIDGKKETVPAEIGILTSPQTVFSPLHTHDTSGIIHVESPTEASFTLGQFFDVWGVRFTQSCIGGYCAGDGKTLQVFVDGHRVTGDPAQVELQPHQEIVVAYGTDAELPSPVPSSYTFPLGL
jgi:hypothetical protein